MQPSYSNGYRKTPVEKERVLVSEDIPRDESWLGFIASRCLHNGYIVAPFGETVSFLQNL